MVDQSVNLKTPVWFEPVFFFGFKPIKGRVVHDGILIPNYGCIPFGEITIKEDVEVYITLENNVFKCYY